MKVTNRLTHVARNITFEAAKTEDQLKAAFAEKGLAGFPALLDISRSMTCWRSRRQTAQLRSRTM